MYSDGFEIFILLGFFKNTGFIAGSQFADFFLNPLGFLLPQKWLKRVFWATRAENKYFKFFKSMQMSANYELFC